MRQFGSILAGLSWPCPASGLVLFRALFRALCLPLCLAGLIAGCAGNAPAREWSAPIVGQHEPRPLEEFAEFVSDWPSDAQMAAIDRAELQMIFFRIGFIGDQVVHKRSGDEPCPGGSTFRTPHYFQPDDDLPLEIAAGTSKDAISLLPVVAGQSGAGAGFFYVLADPGALYLSFLPLYREPDFRLPLTAGHTERWEGAVPTWQVDLASSLPIVYGGTLILYGDFTGKRESNLVLRAVEQCDARSDPIIHRIEDFEVIDQSALFDDFIRAKLPRYTGETDIRLMQVVSPPKGD